MFFKFLQKPITIKAVVPESFGYAQKYYPMVPSSKFIPSWWKQTPKSQFNFDTFSEENTVRSCSGIMETFKNGYIQPLWCDLALSVNSDNTYKYQYSDKKSKITLHNNKQFHNFYEDYFYLKLHSPWAFLTSEPVKFIIIDPFYLTNEPKPYIIPYGFLNDRTATTGLNVFLFLNKKEPKNILIKAGTPLLQMVPITDRPIKFVTEVISNREYAFLVDTRTVWNFSNSHLETVKILKKQESEKNEN